MNDRHIRTWLIALGFLLATACLLVPGAGLRANSQRGDLDVSLDCRIVSAGAATTSDGGVLTMGQSLVGRTADEKTVLRVGGGLLCLSRPDSVCLDSADINGDAAVNLLDYALLANCFADTPTLQDCTTSDINCDNVVDLGDLALLVAGMDAEQEIVAYGARPPLPYERPRGP